MKKISLGSWAFPMELNDFCAELNRMGFDGISLGGFKPHANPELYETPEKRAALKKMLKDNGIEVADYAADLWSVDSFKDTKAWLALFDGAAEFMDQLDLRLMRIDSGTQPILPEGMSYAAAKDKVKENFRHCAKKAAEYGIDVVWEFEPGFIVNEPKNVLEVVSDVGEKNFSVLFDTCHGYMSSVIGARHIEEGCVLKGGMLEFIDMLAGKIGHVHVIDSDGSLNGEGTSTHNPFGTGKVDFDAVIPALMEKGGYKGDWWSIDLCEWPDALKVTQECKAFVDKFNAKYCK